MIGKKINQLATELAPASTDLTIIGNPTTGVSKKITLAQLGAIFSGAVSFYTNYAAFPTPGTTDVIYCAKDTQKLYLWSGSAYVEVFPSQALLDTYQLRSEKGNANGYASLDSSGKVPVSQLPSSIMEYKGTWSAATNTPTLANGTGDTGDVYICNAAGSVNFGAGAITFAVGDYVIYSGSIWQRSSGAVGTVTIVAASITGNAIGITGSPVTTSGTLAFAFAGTGAQYIKGDGTLATFPSTISQAEKLITEVYNNTGATLTKGTVVYINGGQGNLPTVTKALATGDSTSAQTFGIVQADITNNNNGYVVVAGKLNDLDTQAYTEGTQLYLSSTTAGAWTSTKQYAPAHLVYVGIVVRSHPTQGVVEVKIQNGYELDEIHNVAAQTPTNNDGLFWEASTSLWKNKSISTILGGTPITGSGSTNYIPKFTASGTIGNSNLYDNGTNIYNNNPSAGQFAWQINGNTTTGLSYGAVIVAGTNASDIALRIQNASSTSELFFVYGDGKVKINNIPNATIDTDVFLVSDGGFIKYRTGAQLLSDIGAQPAGSYVTSVNSLTGAVTLTTTNIAEGTNLYYTDARVNANSNVAANTAARHNAVTIGTANGLSLSTQVLSLALASGSTTGALSSTDWTTFNNKQNALTNPVTGIGSVNYLPKFTGSTTIGNSLIQDNGTNVSINVGIFSGALLYLKGIGATTATYGLYVANSASTTTFYVNDAGNGYFASGIGIGTGPSSTYGLDVNGATRITGNLTATSFIKSGGTSSQYLMADGSVSTLTNPVTGTGTTNYLPKFTGTSTIGNSSITDDGSNVYVYNRLFQSNGTNQMIFGQWDTVNNRIEGSSGLPMYIVTYGSSLKLGAGGSEGVRLNASGNLSIGNTNDTYKLDVSGTGRFSGTVTTGSGSGNTLTSGSIDVGKDIGLVATQGIVVNNARVLAFASSGAATFSSTITATSGVLKNNSSTPTYLDFDGTNRTSGRNYEIGTGYSGVGNDRFYIYDNTANVSRLVIDASGSVGIGTTSPANILDISTPITSAFYGLNLNYTGTSVAAFQVNNATGELKIGGNAAGYYPTFWSAGSERMRITTGGLVGIGTSSPTSIFHVSTSSQLRARLYSSGAASFLDIENGGNSFYVGVDNSTGSDFGNSAYARTLYGTGAYPMIFYTNSTERLRITSTGLIAVNSSTVPNGQMYISGGSNTDVLSLQNNLTTGAFIVFADNVTPTWANAPRLGAISNDMVFRTVATERMRITSGGRIYVGHTADYGAAFSVQQPTSGNVANFSNGADADLAFTISQIGAGTKFAKIISSVSIPIIFGNNGTERLRLATNGNTELTGAIKTGNPGLGSAGAIKLGQRFTGTAIGVGGYIPIDIDGTTYYINLATTTP